MSDQWCRHIVLSDNKMATQLLAVTQKCRSIYSTAESIATYDMDENPPNLFYCTHRYCTRNLHIFKSILMNQAIYGFKYKKKCINLLTFFSEFSEFTQLLKHFKIIFSRFFISYLKNSSDNSSFNALQQSKIHPGVLALKIKMSGDFTFVYI